MTSGPDRVTAEVPGWAWTAAEAVAEAVAWAAVGASTLQPARASVPAARPMTAKAEARALRRAMVGILPVSCAIAVIVPHLPALPELSRRVRRNRSFARMNDIAVVSALSLRRVQQPQGQNFQLSG